VRAIESGRLRGISVSRFIRQFHRWVSFIFVVTVVATAVALAQPTPVVWMSYVPLLPLALLALSGIYLFVLPYAARWRSSAEKE
jgi:hypothetical protein